MYGSGTIADLILQGGDIRARRALARGDAWGNAIRDIGQSIGGYFQQRQQQQQMKKRDAALTSIIEGWDGQDPRMLLQGVSRVLGPQAGLEMTKGLLSVTSLNDKSSEEDARAAAQWYSRLSPEMQQRFWPGFKTQVSPWAQSKLGIDLSAEEYSPDLAKAIGSYGGGAQIKPQLTKLGQGEVLVDEAGRQIAAGLPAIEKPDARSLEIRAAEALAAGDKETYDKLIQAQADLARAGQKPTDPLEQQLTRARIAEVQQRTATARDKANAPEKVKLSASAIERVANIDQALKITEELDKTMDRSWLGPVAGRWAMGKINTPGVSVPKGLAYSYAKTATLRNATIKAITGAQMGEREADRIRQEIPDFKDKPIVWEQKLRSTQENLRMMNRRIIELSGGNVSESLRGSSPVRLSGNQDQLNKAYNALPSGTSFIGPDGVLRRKP